MLSFVQSNMKCLFNNQLHVKRRTKENLVLLLPCNQATNFSLWRLVGYIFDMP